MANLPDPPIGFMSYAHPPLKTEQAKLDGFRERLEYEVLLQTGDPFRIFQDRKDIQWGEAWKRRIEASIDAAVFLIPIITPAFFKSHQCRAELERFIDRERELERDDLILPVYYITCPDLEDKEKLVDDELVQCISERQYLDCRKLRHAALDSAYASTRIEELGNKLARAIGTRQIDAPLSSGKSAKPFKRETASAHDNLHMDFLSSVAGLVEVFDDWRKCQDEVVRELTTSRSVKVFAQIGKSVLSGAAVIFNALEHPRTDAQIKILHAGVNNPYLSERSALRRGADYREWREDIEYVGRVGDRLRGRLGSRLEIRQHLEGYLWRLFIFDDLAYLQPYTHSSDNAERAPVFKFSRFGDPAGSEENEKSLYHMLSGYFDVKWEECAPTPVVLEDMIDAENLASVVALAEQGGRRIFVIPYRLLERNGKELEFHYIGGKRGSGEGWIQALQRESLEEIGTELTIKSSTFTRDLTTDAEFEPLQLSEDPRPYFVYKRTREVAPETADPGILWIVGYETTIPADMIIEPSREIAAVVTLSPELLRKTAREMVTYERIARATDGSGITVRRGVRFDYKRIAKPAQLASLSVKVW
jgi:hypothetical protein